ncbi:universal stress protein [Sulfobacillus thermosulfidooxidans]|uniref:universal stress protein n=1 Tax=Sulfobacillus thermosulfidooxidans TaxID=28034 RepID=UPI00096BACA3|nr:universal stress protein [Sulfobacillus thermosulfidooxidans]OLZ12253.1 histidine kinase [Sulfobacillus thermosulfidooxidans]OLZ12966.1 histidine kinase [Sulfobacillus thermosulfidooxidans]OLZ21767.1 histidine kinase [Sulfobacillus thermosulfidooxidans]
MASTYKRRTPEEILEDIRRMSRGKHRIYLGAAPGVGKTYTMLSDAHIAKEQGIDVVIGVIDTHGREETAELTRGLEAVPLATCTYKGLEVGELDVGAVMARGPDVVLVDELAHTNADNCKNRKRYQDVEDLLAAGINVWSTLNIQHLESLNDTVRQITGIRVRETVPDSIVREANEIRLVDLTPEALIERLKRGKVYQGRRIDQALQNFFRTGNITALRELALRVVADDTDDRLETYMNRHAIEGPWPTHDRIMVAVTPSPNGARLLRRGYRIAQRLKAEFYVVIVRPADGRAFSASDEQTLQAHINLAKQLGAQVVELRDNNVPRALVNFAREHHVTEIVMGESLRTRWQEVFKGSVINEVLRQTSNIDILVVGHERDRD